MHTQEVLTRKKSGRNWSHGRLQDLRRASSFVAVGSAGRGRVRERRRGAWIVDRKNNRPREENDLRARPRTELVACLGPWFVWEGVELNTYRVFVTTYCNC